MPKNKNNFDLVCCIVLFCLFFALGTYIASRKPLWNDEVYSQVGAISNNTYQQIIFSGLRWEGIKSPLFYLQQKAFCDIFHYKNPGNPQLVFDRIFLRVPTVLEISLFLSLLFYFFTRRFNLWFGFLSIFVALSSLMLWWYWAEARPYGLWVFLTGCQMLLFIDILESPVASKKHWTLLSLVHILLALSCFQSLMQITIVSTLVLLKERRWEKCIFLLLIPLALGFYYKTPGPVNNVIFTMTVDQVLRDNIARDRLYALLFYPFLLLLYLVRHKFNFKIDPLVVKSFYFFLAVFSMLLVTVATLSYVREHALKPGQYYVVSRHVIFLMPIGIIAVSYLAGIIWEGLKNINWLRVLLITGILILLFYRTQRVLTGIKQFFLGFHT